MLQYTASNVAAVLAHGSPNCLDKCWTAGPTSCHQDTALGIHNPLAQRLRGEASKLNMQKEDKERREEEVWPLKKEILVDYSLSLIVKVLSI